MPVCLCPCLSLLSYRILLGELCTSGDFFFHMKLDWFLKRAYYFSAAQVIMATRGTAQRPNGTQGKICQFKLVLLGESAVGKSSLVLRFVKGQFHEYQESTIGGECSSIDCLDVWQMYFSKRASSNTWNSLCTAAFLTQTVCLDETTVKFEIWDTAGQERYHSLAPMYYRGAQAAIVVYDITNQVSIG